jgi:hypothetical protein
LATFLWENSAAFPRSDGYPMQVSALNLIIAAQQARGGAAPQRPTGSNAASPAQAAPAAARDANDFAPMAFKASVEAPPAPAQRTAANPFVASAPLGSQLDIRV